MTNLQNPLCNYRYVVALSSDIQNKNRPFRLRCRMRNWFSGSPTKPSAMDALVQVIKSASIQPE